MAGGVSQLYKVPMSTMSIKKGIKIEKMLCKTNIESLKELKVQGISQFDREYEQIGDVETDRQVCNMAKLFYNEQTGSKMDPLGTHPEEIILEHCSPRLLY